MNSIFRQSLLAAAALLSACGGSQPAGDGTPAPTAAHADARSGSHDTISLTREQIDRAGIRIETAGPAQVHDSLPLYGTVVPDAERVREVAARFPGVLRTVARRVGDEVRAGGTLATIESNESLQTYPVTSPLTGVVTARNANPGEQSADRVLFTVADLSTVWVELSLFPRDVSRVRAGQDVRVRNAETRRETKGRIVYVAPFGSSSSQTLTARVQIDNAERLWPPGLYVSAAVTLATRTVPVAVRSEALQNLDGRTVVFVRTAAGFEPRPVRTGIDDGSTVEVQDGLEPGERYAGANSFVLKAEAGKGEAGHED